jgi:dethiobiotin synthetase
MTSAGLRNPDALRIAAACSREVDYALVNPYAFEPAVAPHLAAAQVGVEIRFEKIVDSFRTLSAQADVTVVEGVGGWRVPLGPDGDLADLAVALGLPVVLVVGLRLGCINHALLTVESILGRGLTLAGWVANSVDPAMALREENIATLRGAIDAPCLGVVPWMENPDPAAVAACLATGPWS